MVSYWLDLFTPYTWDRFRDNGATLSGFRARQKNAAFERIKSGDVLLCYLTKLSRWCGALEIAGSAFEDTSPIFADENDPFTVRFNVRPVHMLDFEKSIPIEELWSVLSFTQKLRAGSIGWAQAAKLRQSLISISDADGEIVCEALAKQAKLQRRYALDSTDLKHLAARTVVRTEAGEVEVEVPDREIETEDEEIATATPRLSIRMQAKLAQLGIILGFTVWIPPSDKGRVAEQMPETYQSGLVSKLPLNYDTATLKTIENIDVIWLDRRAIAHAFEVEHTTSIYSGLLRMADLLAMQPRMNINLHIVAPIDRRDQVRKEIIRPVFSVLEGGAMSQKCSFLSYDSIEELLDQPNLSHMRESILKDYEEYFDSI